jgi:hypothetical protein
VTTLTDIYPVANVAHGVGLLLGVFVGLAIYHRAWWIALVAVCAISVTAAKLSTYLHFDPERAAHALAYAGQQALEAGKTDEAVRLFREAAALDPKWRANLDDAISKSGH